MPEFVISDSIFRLFFESNHDAQYLADRKTGKILMANARFTEITGYTQEDIGLGMLSSDNMVPEAGYKQHMERLANRETNDVARYSMDILCKNKEVKTLEFCIEGLEHQGRSITIGSCRDIGEEAKTIKKYVGETKRLQKSSLEAGRANIRIGQLREKIEQVPILSSEIIATNTPTELFEKTSSILCSSKGFNYEDVVFMLIEDDELVVKFSSKELDFESFKLDEENKFTQIARGQEVEIDEDESIYIEPLQGPLSILGVIIIHCIPNEKFMFDENKTVKSSQKDVNRTIAQLVAMRLENIRLFDTVLSQSITDKTTGLFNRRHFDIKIKDEVQRSVRYQRPLSILHIDLDGFKEVNDTLGHLQGDEILVDIGALFLNNSRGIDLIFRYGGDEFVVILPETDTTDAVVVAEKIIKACRVMEFKRLDESKPAPKVTMSIGVASTSETLNDYNAVIKAADTAMYESKSKGKDQVTIAAENLNN